MSLVLTGVIGDKSTTWPLEGGPLGIGRSSRHPIHIPDGTISKDHAEITFRAGQFYIRDLGSRNGTRVNGREAKEPTLLEAGDRVEIGHVMLIVSGEDARPRLNLNEQSVVGSTLRLKTDRILEHRAKTGEQNRLIHLLADAGQLLVMPRPLQETCDELLQFVEKAVPASRYILLLDQGGDEPVQIAARTKGGRADRPLALSRSIMRTVLNECTSVLTGDTAADPRFQAQHSIVAQSVQSAMAVPLFDNEKVLGLMYVDSAERAIAFDSDQLELLTLLANMAAVKITNARLLEEARDADRIAQELATATRIQRGLLPEAPPAVPGWELDAFIEACNEVGGDLYDFHLRDDGRLVFLVGDVTGKGMGAALLMSSFLASARALYDAVPDPGELATRVGTMLHRSIPDRTKFVTGFLGALDPATGTLEYVNAGHPAPLLACSGSLRELESCGPPFGVVPQFPYTTASTVLAPGEVFFLFTDGIPEAQRGEELFDDPRLREAVIAESAAPDLPALRQRLLGRVDAFLDGSPRTDDITMLLLRRRNAVA